MKILKVAIVGFALISQIASAELYGDGYVIVEKEAITKGDDLEQTIYRSVTGDTVRDALQQILKSTGWRFAEPFASDPNLNRLLNQPYPAFKRALGPVSLLDALEFVGGDAWDLVIDPVNKLVSYQLSTSYRCFTLEKSSCPVSK